MKYDSSSLYKLLFNDNFINPSAVDAPIGLIINCFHFLQYFVKASLTGTRGL